MDGTYWGTWPRRPTSKPRGMGALQAQVAQELPLMSLYSEVLLPGGPDPALGDTFSPGDEAYRGVSSWYFIRGSSQRDVRRDMR